MYLTFHERQTVDQELPHFGISSEMTKRLSDEHIMDQGGS